MYYRRKLILEILNSFKTELTATSFQKILFLVTRYQKEKAFDFVPYKYGCYSFQANQDLNTLVKYGYLDKKVGDSTKWELKRFDSDLSVNQSDKQAISYVKNQIENMSGQELITYTYKKYPYYATKSKIAEKLLSIEELQKVKAQEKKYHDRMLFTIGYEGISLETYLNKLIINDIRLLCDVRKNPLSRKFGFSKKQLKNACEQVGINYIHIPELGIKSEKRKDLNTNTDYKKLFEEYDKTVLVNNKIFVDKVEALLFEYSRIALTCFEKEPHMCHRNRILNCLIHRNNWNTPYKNL